MLKADEFVAGGFVDKICLAFPATTALIFLTKMCRSVQLVLFASASIFSLCGCSSMRHGGSPRSAVDARIPCLTSLAPDVSPSFEEGINQGSASLIGEVELDLALLVDVAFENSPEIRRAWHGAKIAELEYRRSLAPFFPAVNAAIGTNWERQGNFSGGPSTHLTSHALPSVEMACRLFSFGADRAGATAAKWCLQAANFSHGRSLQSLLRRVQSAYFNLDAALAMVDARKADLRDAEEMAHTVEIGFQSGLESRQNYLMARTACLQARYRLEETKALAECGRATLAEAVGVPVTAKFRIRRSQLPEGIAAVEEDVNRLVVRALRMRPDLLSHRFNLLAAEALESRARLSRNPQVIGKLSATWLEISGGRSGKNATASIGISWDVFTGFERTNQLLERREEVKIAKEGLRAAELHAIGEIWSAHFGHRSAFQQLESARALLVTAEEAHAACAVAYRNGLSSINELLHAQGALAMARGSLADAECHFSVSLAELAYVTGSLDDLNVQTGN
jgi:outer membrane protein TolC